MQVSGDGVEHVLDVRRADAQERAGGDNRSRMIHGSPESDPRDLERLAFFRPDDARPRLAAKLVNGGIGDVRTDKRVAGADLAHGITPACVRNTSHEQTAVLQHVDNGAAFAFPLFLPCRRQRLPRRACRGISIVLEGAGRSVDHDFRQRTHGRRRVGQGRDEPPQSDAQRLVGYADFDKFAH